MYPRIYAIDGSLSIVTVLVVRQARLRKEDLNRRFPIQDRIQVVLEESRWDLLLYSTS